MKECSVRGDDTGVPLEGWGTIRMTTDVFYSPMISSTTGSFETQTIRFILLGLAETTFCYTILDSETGWFCSLHGTASMALVFAAKYPLCHLTCRLGAGLVIGIAYLPYM